MIIEYKKSPLRWGSLDVTLFGITKDWHGNVLSSPAAFGLAMDDENLWFVSSHQAPPLIHPDAAPGRFTPELWKYDVAEFFIYNEVSGRYLEVNLAANGAWWCAEFTAPRVMVAADDAVLPEVSTYTDHADDGSWISAACVPLDFLRTRFDFDESSRMNVSFIIHSPEQQFLSVNTATSAEPDFHHMDLMKQVQIQ